MIHYFKNHNNEVNLKGYEIPSRFTFPFQYTPHPLIIRAAEEVKSYLQTRLDWQDELTEGKMFGVLLIKTSENKIGYLAGFSGNLAGSNQHSFFVPPVFDLLRPGDFFKVEENHISAINHRISELAASPNFICLQESVKEMHQSVDEQLKEARQKLKESKRKRDIERNTTNDDNRLKELIKESQFQKAEFKRLEHRLKEELVEKDKELQLEEDKIRLLKQERKTRSAALQYKLFEHFQMLNANGQVKDLNSIFKESRNSIPPAGAGECALPKMLQYAYLHKLKPLAFGEFWWGKSPKEEIRHHGQFYPSCKGKCEPILQHMLIGLDVDPDPLAIDSFRNIPLPIIYEDQWMVVVNKPAGMLSTPGKKDLDSVSERLHRMYPKATGPMLVHRLDMATSGILIAAKNKESHALLQELFENRKIIKIYTAVLDGIPSKKEGDINLPLCSNPEDRPRQMVNFKFGKEATTHFKVIKTMNNYALVKFYLETGRTHQIRMHAAHSLGLGCPIKGDDLYGKHADRLYLHATAVEFIHPVTKKRTVIHTEIPFEL